MQLGKSIRKHQGIKGRIYEKRQMIKEIEISNLEKQIVMLYEKSKKN